MGDVQDAEVFLSTLVEFEEETGSASQLKAACHFFEQRRAEAISNFMKNREELQVFWRAMPVAKFSWEQQDETLHRSSRHRSGGRDARL